MPHENSECSRVSCWASASSGPSQPDSVGRRKCNIVRRCGDNMRTFTMCRNSAMLWWFCLIVTLLISDLDLTNAKHLDPRQRQHMTGSSVGSPESCESVVEFFDSLNITLDPQSITSDTSTSTGSICGGRCCSNTIEHELLIKSTTNFDRLLRHHTRSLRGNLELAAKTFRDHVLELTHQSENKTLYLFSQVYRRMAPLSRRPILEFYKKIRNHINGHDDTDFDSVARIFFMELFPVAYHHAVHSSSETLNGDFHDDYKNCLMHTYDDLQPFGGIPKTLAKSLKQSIGTANIFITVLDRGADILASTEEIDSDNLTQKCRNHLTKMNFCPECNGIAKSHTKPCYGYCTNVMRGCLAQYVGVLDSPWSSVAESIESLWHNSIRTDLGIEEVIKNLDAKLSEAIMHAMENGPELEKKVKKSCGSPTLLSSEKIPFETDDIRPTPSSHHSKWVSPPNTEMLRFLVSIDKSKDFYSKIVDSVCEDEDYIRDDRHCWTGDRIGDYTQTVMSTGVDAQKYNPEVPLETHGYTKANKLTELVDKLIKLRHTVAVGMSSYSPHAYSDIQGDIQGDMARHDEDGSGGGGYRDDLEDDEYNGLVNSGDGSGDDGHSLRPSLTRTNVNETSTTETAGAASTQFRISTLTVFIIPFILTTTTTMLFSSIFN